MGRAGAAGSQKLVGRAAIMLDANNAELSYHLMPARSFSPPAGWAAPHRAQGMQPSAHRHGQSLPPRGLSPGPQAEVRTLHVEQRGQSGAPRGLGAVPPPSPPGSSLKLAHPLLADARHKDKLAVLDLLFKASIK